MNNRDTDGSARPRPLMACSGEIDLTAAPVVGVDDDADPRDSSEDLRVLITGDGPLRVMDQQPPRAPQPPPGLSMSSASLVPITDLMDPNASMTGAPALGFAYGGHLPMGLATIPGAAARGIAPAAAAGGGKGIGAAKELQRLHRLLRGRYLCAIFLALVFGAAGVVGGYRSGAIVFRSAGTIRIMPRIPGVFRETAERDSIPMFETFMDAQISLLRSQRVMQQAMDEAPWRELRPDAQKTDAELAGFSRRIEISRSGEMLVISALDLDPHLCVAAVDATIAAYQKVYEEVEGSAGDRMHALRKAVQEKLREEYARLQGEIHTIAKPYGTEDLTALVAYKQSERNQIESKIRELNVKLDAANNKVKVGEAAPAPAIKRPQDVAFMFRDPVMVSLLERKARLEDDAEQARLASGINSSQYIRAQARVDDAWKKIADYTVEFQKFLKDHPDGAAKLEPGELLAQRTAYQVLFDKIDAEWQDLAEKAMKIALLRDKALAKKSELDAITKVIDQAEIERRNIGRLVVMNQAERPLGPFRDTRMSTAMAGGVAGVALGFGSMLALGLLNRRIEHPDDAEAQHGAAGAAVPLLGLVPRLPDNIDEPEHAALAAHCVHEMRTRLQILGQGQPRPTFGITSPTAGSGKTSLTLALGLSFAAARQRTLLIDCDIVGGGLTRTVDAVARRRVGAILVNNGVISQRQLDDGLKRAARTGQRLGEALIDLGHLSEAALDDAMFVQQGEALGLLDALDGEDIASCVAPTGIDDLWVLPLGNATFHDAASMSLVAFRRLLDRATRQFDVILVDTGPILGSLEASVVASQTDAVVLAVAKGESRAMIDKAVGHLSGLGTRIAGMVFNRAIDHDVIAYSKGGGGSSYGTRSTTSSNPGASMAVERKDVPGATRLGPVARAVASWSAVNNPASVRQQQRARERGMASAN